MSKSEKKIKTNIRNYVLALALLLITNILTSYTLAYMAHDKLHSQIERRMFDIVNTAADGVDGDFLATYQGTEEEKDTEGYRYSMFVLDTMYNNIELSYIYCVRYEGNDRFIFTLDPDTDAPAAYGEEIVVSEALLNAQKGTPSFDEDAHSDSWGTFYSAFSPVFDSNGNVVSVIGVDFDAEQHDKLIKTFMLFATLFSFFALLVGIALAVFIIMQNKKRMSTVLENIEKLDHEMVKLDGIITESSVMKMDMLPENENVLLKTLASGETGNKSPLTEYDIINTGVDSVLNRLKRYIKFVENDVYTDDTTGVNNKLAYKNKIKELDDTIAAGNAKFSVAFFDINEVKKIYTHYGFEAGEQIMYNCSKLLKAVFGKQCIYHITGDEFVILAENKSKFDMRDLLATFDEELEKYNADHVRDHILSVAKGYSSYNAEKHKCYRDVLVEAKANCDKDKSDYYRAAD